MESKDKCQNLVVGRTVWDILFDKRVFAVAGSIILILLALSALGLIEFKFKGEVFEIKTKPLKEVHGDPVEVKINSKKESKQLKQILIPTFTDTLVNYGGSTDGDYLHGITQIFAAKLSSLYTTKFIQADPERSYGFDTAFDSITNTSNLNPFGILVGSVHKYQDERPDIGQKALLSITLNLFTEKGKTLWTASQTTSAKSSENPSDHLNGIQAIELLERMSTEMVRELEQKLK